MLLLVEEINQPLCIKPMKFLKKMGCILVKYKGSFFTEKKKMNILSNEQDCELLVPGDETKVTHGEIHATRQL